MGVREALLALLREGPAHGYQLKSAFETATARVWPLNVGQVYTTLERLERDGLVGTDEADGQRAYAITSDGAEELGAWWEAAPVDDPPPRDELMLKVLLAIAVDRDLALEVIDHQRNALLTRMQQRQRAQSRRPPRGVEALVDVLVTDVLLMRGEADLRWLDRCEERLLAGDEADNSDDNGRRRRRARQGGRS